MAVRRRSKPLRRWPPPHPGPTAGASPTAERLSVVSSIGGLLIAPVATGTALLTWNADRGARLQPTPPPVTATIPASKASTGTMPVSLVDLEPALASSPFFNEQTALIAGAVYPDSIVIQFDGSEPVKRLEYALDRRYTALTATVSLEDASTASKDSRLDFFGDGRLLNSYKPQIGLAHPLRLRLDQIARLTIVSTSKTQKCCVNIAIGFPVMAAK